jgi:hypothetical protein
VTPPAKIRAKKTKKDRTSHHNIIISPPNTKYTMTPEQRIQGLQKSANDFSTYLKTTPGIILSPQLRLGIAICAQDALLNCKRGCHRALNQAACLRPGASFYAYCLDMEHEPPFPMPPGSDRDVLIDACLINIVHAVVCHQNRLDGVWYRDALKAIQKSGILDGYTKEFCCENDANELGLASNAVFYEVVVLAAVSHGIQSMFLALGSLGGMSDGSIPPLPSWKEMEHAPPPNNIRFSSLLKRVRQYESEAHAPYFYNWDINKRSSEYELVEKEVWKKLPMPSKPNICASFSPRDNAMMFEFMGKLYLSQMEMVFDWNELDTTKHCSSVTRFDIETVAGAVATANNCDF